MSHPYSGWLRPGNQVFGSNPVSDLPSMSGTIPGRTYVLVQYPFPERGEAYVQSTVDQMRQEDPESGAVIKVEEISIGSMPLSSQDSIYVHRDVLKANEGFRPPELSELHAMGRLL